MSDGGPARGLTATLVDGFFSCCHFPMAATATRPFTLLGRGGCNGRRPVLGCRIGGPAGALGVIQRHGRGCGDDRLLGNCCLRDTRVDGSRLRSSTRATNSPTTRAAHTRDSPARKFPDVTTNQYNRSTSPVRFLPDRGNSTVGFTACTNERGDATTRRTPTDRATLVRIGWSPPLYDTYPESDRQ